MSVLSDPESRQLISGPAGELEVRVTEPRPGPLADQSLLAVICHPHPLHGGTMDNKVVTTLMRSYRDLGVKVISFNFRGVGLSQGSFDQGRGELEDLLAVVRWGRENFAPEQLLLAGFSFGSAMAAQASHELSGLAHLLLLAPPVERYAYDRQERFSCPLAVVIGSADERVDVAGVRLWAGKLQPAPAYIEYPQAGHFFHGFLTRLKADVALLLTDLFAS
jgi:alpha/beta superfamily hydrolase